MPWSPVRGNLTRSWPLTRWTPGCSALGDPQPALDHRAAVDWSLHRDGNRRRHADQPAGGEPTPEGARRRPASCGALAQGSVIGSTASTHTGWRGTGVSWTSSGWWGMLQTACREAAASASEREKGGGMSVDPDGSVRHEGGGSTCRRTGPLAVFAELDRIKPRERDLLAVWIEQTVLEPHVGWRRLRRRRSTAASAGGAARTGPSTRRMPWRSACTSGSDWQVAPDLARTKPSVEVTFAPEGDQRTRVHARPPAPGTARRRLGSGAPRRGSPRGRLAALLVAIRGPDSAASRRAA